MLQDFMTWWHRYAYIIWKDSKYQILHIRFYNLKVPLFWYIRCFFLINFYILNILNIFFNFFKVKKIFTPQGTEIGTWRGSMTIFQVDRGHDFSRLNTYANMETALHQYPQLPWWRTKVRTCLVVFFFLICKAAPGDK